MLNIPQIMLLRRTYRVGAIIGKEGAIDFESNLQTAVYPVNELIVVNATVSSTSTRQRDVGKQIATDLSLKQGSFKQVATRDTASLRSTIRLFENILSLNKY